MVKEIAKEGTRLMRMDSFLNFDEKFGLHLFKYLGSNESSHSSDLRSHASFVEILKEAALVFEFDLIVE